MTLYSHNQAYPALLPFRIVLSSGATRTDPATFTPAEITDAGYVEAPPKPEHDQATHSLGWDGSDWTIDELPPVEPHFALLSARQLRLGLIAADISIGSVDGAIAAIPDPSDREIALVEWEYASQFERDHHLIEMIGSALGMTIEQIDAAWIAAMEL